MFSPWPSTISSGKSGLRSGNNPTLKYPLLSKSNLTVRASVFWGARTAGRRFADSRGAASGSWLGGRYRLGRSRRRVLSRSTFSPTFCLSGISGSPERRRLSASDSTSVRVRMGGCRRFLPPLALRTFRCCTSARNTAAICSVTPSGFPSPPAVDRSRSGRTSAGAAAPVGFLGCLSPVFFEAVPLCFSLASASLPPSDESSGLPFCGSARGAISVVCRLASGSDTS